MESNVNGKRVYPQTSDTSLKSRNRCMYDTLCYRKNPSHLVEYSHPHLENILFDWDGASEFKIPDNLSMCKDVMIEQLQILVQSNKFPSRGKQGMPIETKTEGLKPNTSAVKDQPKSKHAVSDSQPSTSKVQAKPDNNVYDKRTNSFIPKDESDTQSKKFTKITAKEENRIIRSAAEYLKVRVPPGGFAAKLKAAAPYNMFLTTVTDAKITHNEPLSVTFQELLDKSLGELESSVQINFMVDIGWLLAQYYFSENNKKPLLILYGEETPELREVNSRCPNVTSVKVQMASPFGKHHTKMSLFAYKDGSMRVVISTANLYEPDWENRTQGLWISPTLPSLGDEVWDSRQGESPTGFRDDLLRYLISYKISHLQSWIARIRKTDFSAINVFLMPSIPGGHRGIDQSRYGHTRLSFLLQKHCKANAADTVIAQSSSIGSLGPNPTAWAGGEFLTSASRTNHPPGLRSLPPFKMIYPSFANVRASHDGLLGGGCLPYTRSIHEKQTWIMTILHQWRAKCRNRSAAVPHIKCYTRVSGSLNNPNGLHWFVLTSGNLSKAAWGSLNKTPKLDPPLRIMSYEVGVLYLPQFVIGTDLFPLDNTSTVPPFPLPYDLPLTPYNPDDSPFFFDIYNE